MMQLFVSCERAGKANSTFWFQSILGSYASLLPPFPLLLKENGTSKQ